MSVYWGLRVTFAYDVFLSPTYQNEIKQDSREPALEAALRNLFEDEQFLPEGGTVGFALQHQYTSYGRQVDWKGADAVLVKLLGQLGVKWEVRFVYNESFDDEEAYELVNAHRHRKDGQGPCRAVFPTSNQYNRAQGGYFEGFWPNDMELEWSYGVVWVPEPKLFANKESYIMYGNEASPGGFPAFPVLFLPSPGCSPTPSACTIDLGLAAMP